MAAPDPTPLRSHLPTDSTLRWFRAPGRVNLIGDHTDYCDGWCLPVAIDREVLVAAAPRTDGRIRAWSDAFPDRIEVPAAGPAPDTPAPAGWGGLMAALAHELATRGVVVPGAELAVGSTVPVGSGLSSSAAFEVAVALALAAQAECPLEPDELVFAAQAAEQRATGVPTGVLDQLASVRGTAGHALLLDCRSLSTEAVPLPDLDILVVHSGMPRALTSSEYAQRRRACEAAAARLGVPALRDATLDQVADYPFARHVVSENARVLAFVDALRASDHAQLGALMLASHESLRDDYRVSTPELDLLVRLLVQHGALGARVTGAGFGGCVVALTEPGEGMIVAASALGPYRARSMLVPTAFVARSAEGAAEVESPTSG
ncbi:MAG: galactokinase [Acidimicrobiia bacterium]